MQIQKNLVVAALHSAAATKLNHQLTAQRRRDVLICPRAYPIALGSHVGARDAHVGDVSRSVVGDLQHHIHPLFGGEELHQWYDAHLLALVGV